MEQKPKTFIGSSTEGLPIADATFEKFSHHSTPIVWTNQVFQPGKYPMEVLEEKLRAVDFAVLIASPDDVITMRGQSSAAMRDNVLLEFGMFLGVLGRRRAFFMPPSNSQIQIPSDLFGLVVATYDESRVGGSISELSAAVQIPCQKIRAVIDEEWQIELESRKNHKINVANSERGSAIRRLHSVAVELRDAVAVVQRDSLAALSDQLIFEQVKKTAAEKVVSIANSYSKDAESVNAVDELSCLVNLTVSAVEDLPFPIELATGNETMDTVVDAGFGALSSFLQGGDPVRHVQNKVAGETDRRIESLKARYGSWWDSVNSNIKVTHFGAKTAT